jgi:hypothetical protein
MSHILERKRFVVIVVAVLLLVMVTGASAQHCETVQGLVFIDDNLNGVWDVGEAGYGGEMQTVEEDDGWMHDEYVGATVTIYTPAYDDFVLTSAGYSELGEDEEFLCCHQDAMLNEDDVNPNQVRPCVGTWGLPGIPDDIRLEVWVTAPDGYVLTSENPQYFITGEDSAPLEFGLTPVEEADAVSDAKMADEDKSTPPVFSFVPEGTGFVSGLVFIDDNENGVWDVNEAGYGGQMQLVEEDDGWMHEAYVGATIKLTSPAYDEVKVTSAPYKEPDEDGNALCTPQDYGTEDDRNPNPMRPCAGTWGITQAGDDVYWVVDITVPDGYRLTSTNPQSYVTGSGAPFVDFGIVPIDEE